MFAVSFPSTLYTECLKNLFMVYVHLPVNLSLYRLSCFALLLKLYYSSNVENIPFRSPKSIMRKHQTAKHVFYLSHCTGWPTKEGRQRWREGGRKREGETIMLISLKKSIVIYRDHTKPLSQFKENWPALQCQPSNLWNRIYFQLLNIH